MGVVPEKRPDGKFRKRVRRRLYYGDMANLDVPSLPLTELAVDYFHDSAPGKLGHVDLDSATNIIRENKVSTCSMVVSVLYAKRLRQRSKQYLDSMSSSDIFFISMMMASKYMYDEGTDDEVYNDEWAVSVDQEVCDVNKMEIDFLEALDWKLFVRPDEFEGALAAIEKRLALQQGLKRGWFTYAEMDVLMGPDLIGSLWSCVGAECSRLVASLLTAYITSLLSMLGSVVLASQVSGPLSSATVAILALNSAPSAVSPLDAGSNLPLLPSTQLPVCEGEGSTALCLEMLASDQDMQNETDYKGRNASKPDVESAGQSLMVEEGWSRFKRHEKSSAEEDYKESGSCDKVNLMVKGGCAARYPEDNGGQEDGMGKPPQPRQSTSSLWSLWFLDSLLSQILSVSTFRSQSRTSKGHSEGAINGNENMSNTEDSTAFFTSPDELSVSHKQPSSEHAGFDQERKSSDSHCCLNHRFDRRWRMSSHSSGRYKRLRHTLYSEDATIRPELSAQDSHDFMSSNLGCEVLSTSSKSPGSIGFLSSVVSWLTSEIGTVGQDRGDHPAVTDSRTYSPATDVRSSPSNCCSCGPHPNYWSARQGYELSTKGHSCSPCTLYGHLISQHSGGGGGSGQVYQSHAGVETRADLVNILSGALPGISRILQVA